MTYEIEIPSKTFLLGEYAVLSGSPATLVATKPHFVLKVGAGQGLASGFHPESAAGLFVREHRPMFSRLDMEFFDPHEGKGGFGASSAQYLAVWALWALLQGSSFDLATAFSDFKKILALKKDPSSGADFLCQAVGGAPILEVDPLAVLRGSWKFQDMGFAIFRTGVKVQTHEHLIAAELPKNPEFHEVCVQSLAAFKEGIADEWIENVRRYAKLLKDQGLVAGSTRTLLSRIEDVRGVLFAKGSGSLGADTIVVYMKPDERGKVTSSVRALGLDCVATDLDLSTGLVVKNFVFGGDL